MSLRRYLFLLVGCLIAVMTVTQLIIISWIERNMAKEVDIQARQFSQKIIELAVDKLEESATQRVYREDPHQSKPGSSVENNIEVITFDSNNPKKVVKHVPPGNVHQIIGSGKNNKANIVINSEKLSNDFKVLVENLHNESAKLLEGEVDQAFIVHTPTKVMQTKVTNTLPETNNGNLFNKIQLVLILVGITGLVFAYWLSIQFNKPLKKLTQGFTQLAKGDYQTQVKEQGVYELRQTIAHFNAMTQKLAHLTKVEQKHQEVTHLAELGEVSRGLAHALRNPIHTIGLSIEQLNEQEVSPEEEKELIKTIQFKIANIDRSIKALLTLTTSGIQRDENIPILAVVQDIILEYKSSVTKPINFTINAESQLSIKGAESEIRSILHTMINNACEASKANHKVTISASVNNAETIIQVLDEGSGIAPEIKNELFNPHVSTKPEGAGMGLYIAKRLLTLHYDGTLTLANRLGEAHKIIGVIAEAHFKR